MDYPNKMTESPYSNTNPIECGSPSRRAYKIHEVADILGVTSISVRRLIDRGLLRPCRALRHVLVPADEIEKLLKK